MKRPALLAALSLLLSLPSLPAAETLVYIGTYTRGDGGSEGIYVSRLDPETGRLSAPELAAATTNPSFLDIHPSGTHLYAVSEVPEHEGQPGGAVTAFRVDPASGRLQALNARSSQGGGPCHISVDPSGRCVVVANYGGGSTTSFPLAADGSLLPAGSHIQHTGSSVNPRRQKEPHAHSANISADSRHAFVADLGIDQVLIYRLDPAAGTLAPHGSAKIAPGSGPRHFALHPGGKWAWVINELTLTLTGFAWNNEAGTLTEIQTIGTIPDADRSREGLSTAEVRVHPSGQFVYGSNRGHDTIAVFRVDPATGQLSLVEIEPIQGKTPRNFNIDPSGRWLLAAGQGSNSVSVFRIDPATGALEFTGQKIEVGTPVCIRFIARP